MSKPILFVVSLFMCIVFAGCDEAKQDNASLLLGAGITTVDKNQVIDSVTNTVTQQLISEGKAQLLVSGGNSYVMPVEPYTYAKMQMNLETALQKELGDNWLKDLNQYVHSNPKPVIAQQEVRSIVPNEVLTIINKDNPYKNQLTQDTGWIGHYFPSVGDVAGARMRFVSNTACAVWTGAFWWVYGLQNYEFQLQFNYATAVMGFAIYDQNQNPFTGNIWVFEPPFDGTGRYTGNSITLESVSVASWTYPNEWVRSWCITSYNGSYPDSWVENF